MFALAGLIWVLHDIHPQRALRDFARIDWRWGALGVCCDLLSYAAQGLRWRVLLLPLGRVRLRDSVRAVFGGLFANEVLPLRSGEVLRAYVVARAAGISFTEVLTSVGVERLIDGVVLALAIAIVSIYVPLGGRLERAAGWLGVTIVGLVLLAAAVLFFLGRRAAQPGLESKPDRRPGRVQRVIEGLRQMGTSPSFYVACAASVLTPLLQALALWLMLQSYGLELPVLAAAAVLFLINLGVALPNAPGNVGSYQFFCVLGLTLFGVDKTSAAGFSIFVFVAFTIPLLLAGFIAVTQSGLAATSLRSEMARLLQERRTNPSVNS